VLIHFFNYVRVQCASVLVSAPHLFLHACVRAIAHLYVVKLHFVDMFNIYIHSFPTCPYW
jgi:hypothetical protein